MKTQDRAVTRVKRLCPSWIAVGTLALACLVGVSAQAQTSGQMRPMKAKGIEVESIPNANGSSGTLVHVGTATHWGNFVGEGTWAVIGASPDGRFVEVILDITYTVANGDTVSAIGPVTIDNGVSPRIGWGTFVFTGGTGRFENVTGWGEWGVTYHGPPVVWADGVINY